MNILITGGAGFIGSHVVDRLCSDNNVVVIDNLSNGSRKNLPKNCKFYKNDITDNKVGTIFKNNKIDIVIHCAANVFLQKSIDNPIEDAKTNILGSLRILENCVKHDVKKIIYTNSGGAGSGNPKYFPIDENHPIDPLAHYGVSKHTVEHYLEVYRKIYGLKYTSLRLSNVYGPRQNPKGEGGVIAIFVYYLLNGKKPPIYGNGEQTRDFVFVNDVVDSITASMKKGDGDFLNISTAKEVSINSLFELVKKCTNSKLTAEKLPSRPGDIKRSVLSNKKAQKILGWSPKTSLDQGIKKTVEWYIALPRNKQDTIPC